MRFLEFYHANVVVTFQVMLLWDEHFEQRRPYRGAETGLYTICPRISDSSYMVRYYIRWVTTSWTVYWIVYCIEGGYV